MAENDPRAPVAPLSRTRDDAPAERAHDLLGHRTGEAEDFGPGAARSDPETGEVRAGPGDAGLEHSPEVNAGKAGNTQMSNTRLAIGLGIAAVLTILGLLIRTMF